MSGKRKYRVSVTDNTYGSVTAEADGPEKASELDEKAYENGDVVWGKMDFQTVGAEEA